MIRVKEKIVLCILEFHKDNSAMEYAFIQDFLIDKWHAQKKTSKLFEFEFPFPGVDEIQNLIESIEIYLEKSKDSVVLYYFMPTGINGSYKFFTTAIGKGVGEDPNSNILGL